MAIVLLPSQQIVGIQTESQFCLAALLWICDTAVFPDPFTVADVKAALDAGQPVTWSVANFNQFLTNIWNLNLDTTALTLSERTRLNLIFEYLSPSPSSYCCGADVPIDPTTYVETYARIGSASFQYELQVLFDAVVTCSVFKVIATLTPNGGAPAALVSPVDLYNAGCEGGKRLFKKLWIDFASTPVGVGFDYDILLDIQDSTGATITTFSKAGVVLT